MVNAAPGYPAINRIISDGDMSLAVPSPQRWLRYTKGVAAGCDDLAASYGVGSTVRLGTGDLVVDVGANIGEVSLAAAARGATVVALEPEPSTFALLEHNVNQAGRSEQIHTLPIALGDSNRTTELFRAPDNADSSLVEPDRWDDITTVEVMRLDSVEAAERFENSGVPHPLTTPGTRISWLKCDAEGFEPEVLIGASGVLDSIDHVSLDCGFERHGQSTADRCVGLLEDAGFDVTTTPAGQRVFVVGIRRRSDDDS